MENLEVRILSSWNIEQIKIKHYENRAVGKLSSLTIEQGENWAGHKAVWKIGHSKIKQSENWAVGKLSSWKIEQF